MNQEYYFVFPENNSVKIVKENKNQYYLNNIFTTFGSKITISTRPLLRYPGGKTRAVNLITKLIPNYVKEICSPFLGGGSIELACTGRGIKIFGYDIFEELVEFWQCLLHDSNTLSKKVQKYYPLSRDKFYHLQKTQSQYTKKLERAAIFYVLNRASFSGSTLSGGMSPKHPRFTPSSINRLYQFKNPNITVYRKHFRDSLAKHPNTFLYLDPPYLIKNHLYGKNGDTHKNFEHEELFSLLENREQWLLSYNNCPEILNMYKNHKILYPFWKYGMSNDKSSKEVLIMSRDLQNYFGV